MTYNIGDKVKIEVYVTAKWIRLVNCQITNKYIRNDNIYYTVKEINGSYIGTNIRGNRFIQ